MQVDGNGICINATRDWIERAPWMRIEAINKLLDRELAVLVHACFESNRIRRVPQPSIASGTRPEPPAARREQTFCKEQNHGELKPMMAIPALASSLLLVGGSASRAPTRRSVRKMDRAADKVADTTSNATSKVAMAADNTAIAA